MYILYEHEFGKSSSGQYVLSSPSRFQKKLLVIFKRNESQNHIVDSLGFHCDKAECYVSHDFFTHPMFTLHMSKKDREEFKDMDETIRMYVFMNGLPYAQVKYTNTVVKDVNAWLAKC